MAQFSPAQVAVYFSPHGGATAAVIREVAAARTQILVQASSFTSAPIAKALVDAQQRGVQLVVVLDKSTQTGWYSAVTVLTNAGITVLMDDKHAVAHSTVMVIDSATLLTGSFTFTQAAEEKHVGNLLVIKEAEALVRLYEAHIRLHATHSPAYRRHLHGFDALDSPPHDVSE
jgi:phosphatidylserine/phosphatidylglycerophosphate/cardiolipin synthase-like enzyme